ncbi:glutamate receptor ionotropic, delta-2-like isoform X1 [Palaemon carinicauda]|uniref:glutamate receptor ionotropic, delta-2-like isoform X1 n=2 Tax=Palaemon carinicauda TaxID=392227 RepID=UPI0035B5B91C
MDWKFLLIVLLFRWIIKTSFGEQGQLAETSSAKIPRSDIFHPVTKDNKLMSPTTTHEMLLFLSGMSPANQLYIVYDSTYLDMDGPLKLLAEENYEIIVVKFISGNDLFDIISSPVTAISTDRRHILVFCSLYNIMEIFQLVALRSLESRSIWWLIVTLSKEVAKVLETVLREGSQVVVIELIDQNLFRLSSTLINFDGTVWLREIGTWKKTTNGYDSYLTSEVFTDLDKFYSDFHGRELTITAMDNNPYIVLQERDKGELVAVAGFEYAMMKSLGEALNFTYRVTTPADRKWGGPAENGSVVGMIGDVYKRLAHFAVSEITITGVRETVIDFTYPHYIETLTLLSRAPMEKNRTFAAFSPFTLLVWMGIIATTLGVGTLLTVVTWVMGKYLPEKPKGYNLNDTIFNMFRGIVKQDTLLIANYWPHKFLLLFWYIFCLNISALYSGILIATLIKPSFEKPIDGLTDLPAATKNGFTLVITSGTSMEYLFKSATDGIYAQTWKLFNHRDKSKSFIRHSKDVMHKISDDKLVLINGHLSLQYLAMEEGIRRFYFARNTFAPQYYGAACISGAPYLPKVNKILSYMLEGGLITKWRDTEFQKVAGSNVITETGGSRAFSIKHLQAAFYILLIGLLTAVIVLVGEQLSVYFLDV